MRSMVLRSSSLSLNSAAVHCLSKAINACSSLALGFVCAEATDVAAAAMIASSSTRVSCFIVLHPFVGSGGTLDIIESRLLRKEYAGGAPSAPLKPSHGSVRQTI